MARHAAGATCLNFTDCDDTVATMRPHTSYIVVGSPVTPSLPLFPPEASSSHRVRAPDAIINL